MRTVAPRLAIGAVRQEALVGIGPEVVVERLDVLDRLFFPGRALWLAPAALRRRGGFVLEGVLDLLGLLSYDLLAVAGGPYLGEDPVVDHGL